MSTSPVPDTKRAKKEPPPPEPKVAMYELHPNARPIQGLLDDDGDGENKAQAIFTSGSGGSWPPELERLQAMRADLPAGAVAEINALVEEHTRLKKKIKSAGAGAGAGPGAGALHLDAAGALHDAASEEKDEGEGEGEGESEANEYHFPGLGDKVKAMNPQNRYCVYTYGDIHGDILHAGLYMADRGWLGHAIDIQSIEVRSDMQRKGIATAFFKALVREANARGCGVFLDQCITEASRRLGERLRREEVATRLDSTRDLCYFTLAKKK